MKTAREKRLQKDSDTVSECSTTAQNKLTCPGVSRSLKFVSPAPTTCTSFTYNPNRAFQNHVVYNAFGHLEDPGIGVSTPDLSSLGPLLTSTPISKPGNNNVRNETKIKVIIDYPSKMAIYSKILEPCYEALGKALVHNPPERVASAVVKCEPVVSIVIKHVLRKVSREVNDYVPGKIHPYYGQLPIKI